MDVREELDLTYREEENLDWAYKDKEEGYSFFANHMNGAVVSLHCHKHFELFYLVSGQANVQLEHQSYEMKEGDIVYVAPYQRHRIQCLGKSRFLVVQFQASVIGKRYEHIMRIPYFIKLMMEEAAVSQCIEGNNELGTLFEAVETMILKEEVGKEIGSKSILLALVHALVKLELLNLDYLDQMLQSQTDKMMEVLRYVQEHIEKEITEEEVAHMLGYNTSYFSQLFKRNMKINFSTYLLYYKVSEAEKMLIETNQSVTEIALALGFNSLSYFNRVFKKKHKMAPSQYRKKYL